MSYTFNFDENQLLNHKFPPANKGYDALAVDRFFDRVIADYRVYKKIINELQKLQSKVDRLYNVKLNLEAENATLKKRLAEYEKVKSKNRDNFENIQRISAYEKFLYQLGYDPEKIK